MTMLVMTESDKELGLLPLARWSRVDPINWNWCWVRCPTQINTAVCYRRQVTEAIPAPLASLQLLVRAARQAPGLQQLDTEQAGLDI